MREDEVDLRDYIKVLRERWKIILAVFLVCTIGSGIVSLLSPKSYECSAIVRIGTVQGQLLEDPSQVIEIFKTKPILEEVLQNNPFSAERENLGLVASRIRMREKEGLLEIKGRGRTPEESLKLVEAVVGVLLKRHKEIMDRSRVILDEYLSSGQERLAQMEKNIEILQRKIDQLKSTNSEATAMVVKGYMDSLEKVKDRYEQVQLELRMKRLEASSMTQETKQLVPPVYPEKPVAPRRKQIILVGAFVGLFLGLISATLVEYFKQPLTEA